MRQRTESHALLGIAKAAHSLRQLTGADPKVAMVAARKRRGLVALTIAAKKLCDAKVRLSATSLAQGMGYRELRSIVNSQPMKSAVPKGTGEGVRTMQPLFYENWY